MTETDRRRYATTALLTWGAAHLFWWPFALAFGRGVYAEGSALFVIDMAIAAVFGGLAIAAALERLPSILCYVAAVLELTNVLYLTTDVTDVLRATFVGSVPANTAGAVAIVNLVVVVLLVDRGRRADNSALVDLVTYDDQ